jgi:hypothetical protein
MWIETKATEAVAGSRNRKAARAVRPSRGTRERLARRDSSCRRARFGNVQPRVEINRICNAYDFSRPLRKFRDCIARKIGAGFSAA